MTSRESWREQEQAQDPLDRVALEEGRSEVPVVRDDHRVLNLGPGFAHSQDYLGGFIANPIVTDIVDEQLFNDLKSAGLKPPDARHLMYAVTNRCQAFVTLDGHFLKRRRELESLCRDILHLEAKRTASKTGEKGSS